MAVARFATRLRHLFSPNKELLHQLEPILGYTPRYLSYYQVALMHRSQNDEVAANNERLEFLGDAVLGSVIAEYLFKKYPYQDEGFLTELRSRLVRRESLNAIALKMGLDKLIQYNRADRSLGRSHIFGNALEALVGAVYLDVGYTKTRTFILKGILKAYVDIDLVEATDTNYKNRLLSWAQRRGSKVVYESAGERHEGPRKIFVVSVVLDGKSVAQGTGYTKKEASQAASQKAIQVLGIETEDGSGD